MCFSDVTPKMAPKTNSAQIAAFYRFLRRMELSNKSLSPTCAPAHGDIAKYFFSKFFFDPIPEYAFQWRNPQMAQNPKMASLKHIFLHRIEIFFRKKVCGMWRYLHEQAQMLVKGICC